MNIQTDRAKIPAHAEAVRYLTVTITAPDRPRRTDRPAVNVALVLDRSGSMAGRKIEMARKAVDHAIRLLDARDRLALVCYDHEIDTLLASAPASAEAKTLALKRLQDIDARGNTDLCGGWMKGANEISGASGSSGSSGVPGSEPDEPEGPEEPEKPVRVSRVLILSDGLANQGETRADVLAAKAAELRARGIGTSTFGLGADFDERLMSSLATHGGGHFYFIERPEQIPDFLTSELGEALEVVARDVRLIVSPAAPAQAVSASDGAAQPVELGTLNDFPAEAHADGLHIRLGDLVAGQQVTVVVASRWPARPAGARVGINVRMADRDRVFFPQPMRVDWEVVEAAEDRAQPVDRGVAVEVATLVAERARAAALEANRRGDFEAARAMLAAAAAHLRALGPGIREVEALAAELDEDDSVRFSVAMDAVAMKEVYFQSANVRTSRGPEGKAKRRA